MEDQPWRWGLRKFDCGLCVDRDFASPNGGVFNYDYDQVPDWYKQYGSRMGLLNMRW